MANGWTQERRQRQSELIQTWKPWASSTGPRTTAGKAKASQNANKGYDWQGIRRLEVSLNENQQSLDELSAEFYGSVAERLVDATLDGDFRAIQEIAEAIDE